MGCGSEIPDPGYAHPRHGNQALGEIGAAAHPALADLQKQPRHPDRYALLLGLSYLTNRTEFEKLTEAQPRDKEYESVLRLASLGMAQGEALVPPTRAAVAAGLYRAGYQVVEKDRSLGIERLPSIN